MFSEISKMLSKMKAIRIDIGIETAVTSVERTLRRKSRITRIARMAPEMPSRIRPFSDCSI